VLQVRRKRQRRYAESATGTFKKWKAKSLSLAVGHGGGSLHGGFAGNGSGSRPKKGSSEAYEVYAAWVRGLRPVERAGWLLAQGLLAGFSSAPLILQWTASDDRSFVTSYRRLANESRQLLFVLATVSALGAVDTLAQALLPPKPHAWKHAHPASPLGGGGSGSGGSGGAPRERQWKERGWEERCGLVLVCGLYLGAFVATVVCSVGDAVMHRKDGYTSSGTKRGYAAAAADAFATAAQMPVDVFT
jgi:hypothetical protein